MEINGIHYHVEMGGSGAPLVLLHGFTGSAQNWGELRRALEPQFTVIAIDLPGHGQTDSPPDADRYHIERAAEEVRQIVEQLDAPAPVHLLGYSMGGRLALYTALTYPTLIRSLILESASPGLNTDAERAARRASDEQLAAQIEHDGIAAFADYWSALPLFATQPNAVRERLHAQRLHNNPTGLANSLRGMGTGAQPSLWPRLHDVICPTLLLTGALDTKFTAIAAQMAERMPAARHVTIPDAGHAIHAEKPALYAETVRQFLDLYTTG